MTEHLLHAADSIDKAMRENEECGHRLLVVTDDQYYSLGGLTDETYQTRSGVLSKLFRTRITCEKYHGDSNV